MTGLDVVVALVTHDSEAVLAGCLDSLAAGLDGLAWSLVVVDSGSVRSPQAAVLESVPDAEVVDLGSNRGYAAGVNAAWSRRQARSLLVLNPDVALHPGCVLPLFRALGWGPTGIAVPRIERPDGSLDRSLRREPSVTRALGEAVLGGSRAGRYHHLGEVIVDDSAYRRPGWADWASGAAMLVSRECVEEVGPWDERFFLYSEETDFCLRARDQGYRLRYVPTSAVTHLGGEVHVRGDLWSVLTLNRIRLYRSRHGPASTAAFASAVALNAAIRAPLRPVHRKSLRVLATMGRR